MRKKKTNQCRVESVFVSQLRHGFNVELMGFNQIYSLCHCNLPSGDNLRYSESEFDVGRWDWTANFESLIIIRTKIMAELPVVVFSLNLGHN